MVLPGYLLPVTALRAAWQRHALSVGQPLILVGMMWHIHIWQQALRAQIGMQREKRFAHKGRGFQIREKMLEKVRRVDVARIGITIKNGRPLIHWTVVVDDHLVDREDGKNTSDTTSISRSLLTGHTACQKLVQDRQSIKVGMKFVLVNDTRRHRHRDRPVSRLGRPEPWLLERRCHVAALGGVKAPLLCPGSVEIRRKPTAEISVGDGACRDAGRPGCSGLQHKF